MKRTALASAIALALAGASVDAWAVTSTKDVAVIADKTQVRAGEIVNLAIMGLSSEEGRVDRFGEQDGSTLIATVKSKLGRVILGEHTPGEVEGAIASESNYAAFSVVGDVDLEPNIKYVKLEHGIGRVHIEYPVNAQYEDAAGNIIQDEITVLLQQRFRNTATAPERMVEFDDIAGIGVAPHNDCPPNERGAAGACPYHAETIKVEIMPPSIDPGGLDIVAFVPPVPDNVSPKQSPKQSVTACLAEGIIPATSDRYGRADCYVDAEPDGFYDNEDGIQGVMTVGLRGGQIVVKADTSSISGTIRVTLREVADLMAMENPMNPQMGQNAVRMMSDYLDRDAEGNLKPKEYVYTVRMIQGMAVLALDNRITKAGNYYIEAEFAVGDDAEVDEDGDGYAYSSVDMVYRDTLKMMPTGVPDSLELKSVKQRMLGDPTINDGGSPGTPLMVKFLDQYGNPTFNDPVETPTYAFGNPTTIEILDASGIANNDITPTGVVELQINPGEKSSMPVNGNEWLGDEPGELLAPQGVINLTAKAFGPAGTTLASNPVSISVLPAWLQADPIFETSPRAGDDFDAFKVVAFTSTGIAIHPGRIFVQNVSTEETSEVDPNTSASRSGIVEIRFLQSTVLGSQASVQDSMWHKKAYRWFLVSDEFGQYSQVLYQAPAGIGTNAGISMKLYDAHGMDPSKAWEKPNEDGTFTVVEDGSLTKVIQDTNKTVVDTKTVIPKGPKGRGSSKVLTIPEFAFKMADCFGNPVTVNPMPAVQPGDRDKGTGTFTVRSSNGTVAYRSAEGGAFGIPYRDYFLSVPDLTRSNVSLTYDTNLFKGDDRIEVKFTKPGLVAGPCRGPGAPTGDTGADPFLITTTVGTVDKEQKLETYIDAMKIPVNSEVPLTIESLVEDGKDKNDNTLYRLFSDYENVLVEMSIDVGENEEGWLPDIRELNWVEGMPVETAVSHGSLLDFTSLITGTNGRKVFVVYGGPVPRKPFTLTFDSVEKDAEGNSLLSVTRTIEVVETVAETLDRECSEKYRFACETEEACGGVGGEWLVNTEQCEDPDVACEERLGIFVDNVCYESDPTSGKAETASRLAAASSIDPAYGGADQSETMFSGGLLNRTQKSTVFESGMADSPVIVKINDKIVTAGVLKVQPEDVGKRADVVVGAFHESPRYIYADSSLDGGAWYMLAGCNKASTLATDAKCPSTGWQVKWWPMDDGGYPILSELEPLETVTLTSQTHTVTMYEGNFYYTGPLWIYFGYIVELDDPENPDQPFKVVYNQEPIYINIEK
jgi:hypothetical protein